MASNKTWINACDEQRWSRDGAKNSSTKQNKLWSNALFSTAKGYRKKLEIDEGNNKDIIAIKILFTLDY